MSSLLLLLVCLTLGAIVARIGKPPTGLAHGLNWWVLHVALPALVFELIPKLTFQWQFWFLVLSQWLLLASAWLLVSFFGARLGWSRARQGCLILMSGLGNTSFIGYPLLEALRGREGLALGAISDQLGCFLAFSIGGLVVATLYSGGTPNPRVIALRLITFPAFSALLIGIAIGRLGGWPESVELLLTRLGSTLTPLALFSVGLRFRLRFDEGRAALILGSLSWKLALAPALLWGLGQLTGVSGPVLGVGVLQAAMAPMISAAILTEQYQLEPDLAGTILGVGILASFPSIYLWHLVLP